jgi:hypothetical protein
MSLDITSPIALQTPPALPQGEPFSIASGIAGPLPVKGKTPEECVDLFSAINQELSRLDAIEGFKSDLVKRLANAPHSNTSRAEQLWRTYARDLVDDTLPNQAERTSRNLEKNIDDYLDHCGPPPPTNEYASAAYWKIEGLKRDLQQEGANFDAGAWQRELQAEFPDYVSPSDPLPSPPSWEISMSGVEDGFRAVMNFLSLLGIGWSPDRAY